MQTIYNLLQMLSIGSYINLKILRKTSVGLFLGNETDEVLLPNKYVPENYTIDDELTVFIYLDQSERPVATTLKPLALCNDFASLKVNYTNQFGAFLDWGLEKDLFVPFKEQVKPFEKGKRYLVYVYLDEKTNRLAASSKVHKFLNNENLDLQPNQEVDLIVSTITDLGVNVIINKQHLGLIYKNELYTNLKIGDRLKGYIKTIRPDHKIDVSLQIQGVESIDKNVEKVLQELKNNQGFLGLNDDSHPEEIKTVLEMSKKAFKKAVGHLYKEHKITITEKGISIV